MPKILGFVKRWFVLPLGVYLGLLVHALALDVIGGGMALMFGFGVILYPIPVLLACLPSIYVYRQFGFATGSLSTLGNFIRLFLVGFLTSVALIETPMWNLFDHLLSLIAAFLFLFTLILVLVLVSEKALGKTKWPKVIAVVLMMLCLVAIYTFQYFQSLPHLSQVCHEIESGMTKAEVVEIMVPFTTDNVSNEQLRSSHERNGLSLADESSPYAMVTANGVFCHIGFENNLVTEKRLIFDGP